VIARREALRIISNSRSTVALSAQADEDPDPGQDLQTALHRLDVMRAMAGLTVPEREAILLRYWGGRSDRQVAAVLNAPAGTVKIRIHRAHRKLARELC
jgi:RNA polymerase sigma factor (sigma-70 family)